MHKILRGTTLACPRYSPRFYKTLHTSVLLRADVSLSQPVTGTNRAGTTGKRFWKTVATEDKGDFILVTLDKRPLKTPDGKVLAIPKSKSLLVALIAHEWNNQTTIIKPFALPMTSLAARAIDNLAEESSKSNAIEALMKFLDTDSICFFTDSPAALVELQEQYWIPLLNWARTEFNADIRQFDSLFTSSQPEETKKIFRDVLLDMDPWQLAAMERALYASKSFIIALALVRGKISVEQAAQAAHVEVQSQIQKWGEVEDTHDVDYQEIRRQLSSAACLLSHS